MAQLPLQDPPAGDPAAISTGAGGVPSGRFLWPIVIATVIFIASSRSYVATPGITRIDDKFGHFAVYGLFATLVCRIGHGWRAALWAVVIASAYGVSDEWHQSFVPGRSSEVADWMADTIGGVIAVTLYCGWNTYRRLLETPLWRRGKQTAKP